MFLNKIIWQSRDPCLNVDFSKNGPFIHPTGFFGEIALTGILEAFKFDNVNQILLFREQLLTSSLETRTQLVSEKVSHYIQLLFYIQSYY